jgi:2-C-methyl-D-erythritol 4-phosphate cytidylyltransferase
MEGGAERQDSVRLALSRLDEDCEIVVIHDGARPFVRPALIDESVRAAQATGACVPVLRASDTIKRVSAAGRVIETLARAELCLTQTPQTFRAAVIRRAHAWAEANGVSGTDDAALVEGCGGEVSVIEGDPRNLKVTTPDDLLLGEAIVRAGRR